MSHPYDNVVPHAFSRLQKQNQMKKEEESNPVFQMLKSTPKIPSTPLLTDLQKETRKNMVNPEHRQFDWLYAQSNIEKNYSGSEKNKKLSNLLQKRQSYVKTLKGKGGTKRRSTKRRNIKKSKSNKKSRCNRKIKSNGKRRHRRTKKVSGGGPFGSKSTPKTQKLSAAALERLRLGQIPQRRIDKQSIADAKSRLDIKK